MEMDDVFYNVAMPTWAKARVEKQGSVQLTVAEASVLFRSKILTAVAVTMSLLLGVVILSNASSNGHFFVVLIVEWAAFLPSRVFSIFTAANTMARKAMLIAKAVLQTLILPFVWMGVTMAIRSLGH